MFSAKRIIEGRCERKKLGSLSKKGSDLREITGYVCQYTKCEVIEIENIANNTSYHAIQQANALFCFPDYASSVRFKLTVLKASACE